MLSVGIIGASGYTGAELLHLLYTHPAARVSLITSRSYEGCPLGDCFRSLGHLELTFESPEADAVLDRADVFFTALPRKASMCVVPGILARGRRVIDLSADHAPLGPHGPRNPLHDLRGPPRWRYRRQGQGNPNGALPWFAVCASPPGRAVVERGVRPGEPRVYDGCGGSPGGRTHRDLVSDRHSGERSQRAGGTESEPDNGLG